MKTTSLVAIGFGCGILATTFFFLLKIEMVNAPGDAVSTSPTATSTRSTSTILVASSTATTTVHPTPTPTPSLPPPKPTGGISPTGSPFGHPQNYTIGSRVFYLDGLTVTLVRIDDSRCKPGMVCIWAGELAPVFSVTGGSIGTAVREIQLGTVTNSTRTSAEYTFTLATTTESRTALIVSN